MEQVRAGQDLQTAKINPVQDPQILPISYSLPIWPTRFSSPAASACLSPSFLDLFFRKK